MAKYDELIEDYAEEIAELKRLKGLVAEARKALDEYEPQNNTDEYKYFVEVNTLDKRWQELSDEYRILADKLSQDIDAEYHDVPYAKPRQQGIEKFWQLADV